jgi:F-type H+-transporting ATPase subunit b
MTRFSLWILLALAPICLVALSPASAVVAQDAMEAEAVEGEPASADEPAGVEEDAEAHAEHPASPLLNVDVGAAIWNLLIFGAVFAILAFFVWPPILKGLQAREEQIRSDLEGAEQSRLQAETLRAELDKQIGDAQSQVQAMLADARRDAETAGQKIVEDAKSEAERQRERAVADIETAKKVALSEMAGQTAEIAMTLAKQVVGRELKADDHADLIRQSVDRLPSNN